MLFIITLFCLQADRSNLARQEETPEQTQARLFDKVSSISILYNLILFIITFFTFRPVIPIQPDWKKLLSRGKREVSIISIIYNLMLFIITLFCLQADRSILARLEETPEQRQARLLDTVLFTMDYS